MEDARGIREINVLNEKNNAVRNIAKEMRRKFKAPKKKSECAICTQLLKSQQSPLAVMMGEKNYA